MILNCDFKIRKGDRFRVGAPCVYDAKSVEDVLKSVSQGLPPPMDMITYLAISESDYNPELITEDKDYVIQGDKMFMVKKVDLL